MFVLKRGVIVFCGAAEVSVSLRLLVDAVEAGGKAGEMVGLWLGI